MQKRFSRKVTVILVLMSLFFTEFCNQPTAKDEVDSDKDSLNVTNQKEDLILIDPSQVALKKQARTLLPSEIIENKRIKELNKEQASSWVRALSYSGNLGESTRLVSYQGQTANSDLFIIANIFEYFDSSDVEPFGIDQYLVSVNKKTGKLISGIVVQGYFSGDQLGDSNVVGKGQILNLRIVNSFFNNDTIYVKYKTTFLNPPDSHNPNDVTEEEHSEKFIIREDGVITKKH